MRVPQPEPVCGGSSKYAHAAIIGGPIYAATMGRVCRNKNLRAQISDESVDASIAERYLVGVLRLDCGERSIPTRHKNSNGIGRPENHAMSKAGVNCVMDFVAFYLPADDEGLPRRISIIYSHQEATTWTESERRDATAMITAALEYWLVGVTSHLRDIGACRGVVVQRTRRVAGVKSRRHLCFESRGPRACGSM